MLLQKAMWLQMEQINYKNRIISFVSTLSIKFKKKQTNFFWIISQEPGI